MNLCHSFRARLCQFLDGELSPSEREEVAAHLQSCPACARERDELEKSRTLTRAALGELAPLSAPSELRLKVRGAIEDEAQRRKKPIFVADWRRWRAPKLVWAGTLSASALALMILARPIPETRAPSAPDFVVEPPTSRENQAPSVALSPPRVTARTPAPPAQRATPATRKKAGALPAAPKTAAVAPREASQPREPLPSAVAPPAPQPIPTPARPKAPLPQPETARSFSAPSFPSPAAQKSPPAATKSVSPRRNSSSPASPRIAMPPDAALKNRSNSVAKEERANSPIPATGIKPRFTVVLSALADSPADDQAKPARGAAELPDSNSAPRSRRSARAATGENVPQTAKSTPSASAVAPQADELARDQNMEKAEAQSFAGSVADGIAAAPARSAPTQSRAESAGAQRALELPARSFRLRIDSSHNHANAQIRVVLPPPLRFSANDASASRTVWRGDFAANAAAIVEFSIQGARGGEKIALVVEQNEGNGESRVLETQSLTLPPLN